MDTSLSWIKAYVPELDVTAQEYTCNDSFRNKGRRFYKAGC